MKIYTIYVKFILLPVVSEDMTEDGRPVGLSGVPHRRTEIATDEPPETAEPTNHSASTTDRDGTDYDGTDGAGASGETAPVLARFSQPRSAHPTTVAVVSDPHVSATKGGTWKVYHRTRERLRTALADATDRGVDAVAFTGDLTDDGAVADFEAVDALLSDAAVPVFAVPGNHDVPKAFDEHDTPSLSTFEANYTPGALPFHERVGGVDLLGLNTATTPDGRLDDNHDGAVSADQLAWLDETLPETDAPVVLMHHNLPGLTDGGDTHSSKSSYPVRNDDELVGILERYDVPLAFSGHLHLPAVSAVAGVRQVVVPPLGSFPQAYLQFEVGPTGTTVRYVPVAGRDGVEEAYVHSKEDSTRSRTLADLSIDRLSTLPLMDERERVLAEVPR